MDDTDRQILVLFQREIPLKSAPFEALSRMIRIDSGELLLRVNRLQEDGLLGPLRAFFSGEKLGYRAYQMAVCIEPDKFDQAAYYISGHPGVIQCTRWQGMHNLWFTLVLPQSESVEFHRLHLENLSESKAFLVLETERAYGPQGRQPAGENTKGLDAEEWTALERSLISSVQEDFPLTDHPFRKIAKDLNSSEELVLKQLQFFQKRGILKRIAAAPAERGQNGFEFLVFWNLPQEKADEAGARISSLPAVVSCAKHRSCEGMPYNFLVHLRAGQKEPLERAVEKIEGLIGMWPRYILVKEKEIKRAKIKFFSGEIADWRIQHAGRPVSSEPVI